MKRKRTERTERRRPMPEIDLNETAERRPPGLDRQGLAQMFGHIRSRIRPGQTTK